MRAEFLRRAPDFVDFSQREGTYYEGERAYSLDTASAARAAGLSNVAAASGTAASLLEMVRHRWRPEYRPLAYASGRHVSVDVTGALAVRGFRCRRV